MTKISNLLENGIKIETNVPMPERSERPSKYSILSNAFRQMEVGNSFVYDCKVGAAQYHARKSGVRIVVRDLQGRSVDPGELKKVRIWRSA